MGELDGSQPPNRELSVMTVLFGFKGFSQRACNELCHGYQKASCQNAPSGRWVRLPIKKSVQFRPGRIPSIQPASGVSSFFDTENQIILLRKGTVWRGLSHVFVQSSSNNQHQQSPSGPKPRFKWTSIILPR